MIPWNWLKWRGKYVPKECCGYFLHPLDVYEASLGQSPWTSRTLLEKLERETAAGFFVIIKKKRNVVTFCLYDVKCNECSGASFCIFLWSNYQQLSKFSFYDLGLFSPCYRSSSSLCQVMDLFKCTETFKEKIHSDNNWNAHDFRVTSTF